MNRGRYLLHQQSAAQNSYNVSAARKKVERSDTVLLSRLPIKMSEHGAVGRHADWRSPHEVDLSAKVSDLNALQSPRDVSCEQPLHQCHGDLFFFGFSGDIIDQRWVSWRTIWDVLWPERSQVLHAYWTLATALTNTCLSDSAVKTPSFKNTWQFITAAHSGKNCCTACCKFSITAVTVWCG